MRTLKVTLLLLALSVPLWAANHPETGCFVEFSDNFGRLGWQEESVLLFGSHVLAHDPLKPK